MAKKDKKAKSAEKKARVTQKQEKKASKKDKKHSARSQNDADSSDDDDGADLDAILAEYARQQEQHHLVTETECDAPPPPRSAATLIANPTSSGELFLFGGEYFDGAHARFFNDLFVYRPPRIGGAGAVAADDDEDRGRGRKRREWTVVRSANAPLPRSGHAWTRAGNDATGVYLFGGEFSSPKQGTFYHYNDFWRLDGTSREWSRIEPAARGKGMTTTTPPSRSGHRLTYFKNYIILFGGFQDTSMQTRYLNDLWIYDCNTYKWHEPKLPAGSAKPDPRSSLTFLPHESGAALYGGYSRVKAKPATIQKTTRGGGGGGGASRVVLKPMLHQDSWYLRVTPPPANAAEGALPAVRWERRKRPANPPNPARAGATMCLHKGRGIMFGGVHDVEESEEGIDSEFFNQLFVWNVDRNRFFPLVLRKPKADAGKREVDRRGRAGRGKQAEEELLRNLKALETGGKVYDPDADKPQETNSDGKALDADDERIVEHPVAYEMPHARFNAQLAVQGDSLYILGGTYERADKEFTFDDMWAIDLNKLDGVKQIFHRELAGWDAAVESSDDEGDEDDEEDDDEDDGEEEQDEEESATLLGDDAPPDSDSISLATTLQGEETTTLEESSALTDGLPFPRPFEVVKDFFDRTKAQWQDLVLTSLREAHGGGDDGSTGGLTTKAISASAFKLAEAKWWDCREEIRALEDEQAEAGIDTASIVNLADRQTAAGASGTGRRR